MKASPFVYQRSTTSGTGNLTLTLVTGYRTFASAFSGNGASNLFFYEILDKTTGDYEEGLGYLSGSNLVRSVIISSSNSNNAVSFSSNPKEITCDVSARFQAGCVAVKTLNNNYTVVATDQNNFLVFDSASAVAVTIPPDATINYDIGTQFPLCQKGAGQLTVTAGVGVTIGTPETLKLRKQGSRAYLVKIAANTWTLDGDLELAESPVYVPPGAIFPFAGTAAPTGFVLCYGQAISRTTYATLFAACGTIYGAGDGVNTFNVPDIRGRIVAGQDDMGGSSANRLTGTPGGVDGDVLGGTGGGEQVTLAATDVPVTTTAIPRRNFVLSGSDQSNALSNSSTGASPQADMSRTNNGGAGAHNNVQPTIILNYIIKT